MDRWVWCGFAGIFGIVALFVAAQGGVHMPVPYYGGLGFFVFSLAFIFYHVKQAFDHPGNKH